MPSQPSKAIGEFRTILTPTDRSRHPSIQTLIVDRTFTGDLEATSIGELLMAGDPTGGNAGYVAIDYVSGRLNGRSGSFCLMHSGTAVNAGPEQITIAVVPGTPTGELAGLTGTMTITLTPTEAQPYLFLYTLPETT